MKKFSAPIILSAVIAIVGLTGPAANAAQIDDSINAINTKGSISKPLIGYWPH